ncbi:hypothetical protein [Paraurantiacibacter namhicola]|uniref:YARHG domain-containing protein n=1 Tax=Paraurantiacibacter namhicola TaxID=645517 RepID=A0A1C7D8J7_9SPHN|nr:hypothetical protein [Paraurantiacibacter namhicola]ANU07765.1 hypothetical protein A6F65_01461 [Paraurantiacibacter namhicola]
MKALLSVALVAASLAATPAAMANTKNDRNHSNDRFFKCHVLEDNLWRAIMTGKWPFYCD